MYQHKEDSSYEDTSHEDKDTPYSTIQNEVVIENEGRSPPQRVEIVVKGGDFC